MPAQGVQQGGLWDKVGPNAEIPHGPTLSAPTLSAPTLSARTSEELAADINTALAAGDLASAVDALGHFAKLHGMAQVARDTGMARESLYRSLASGGNPEFATVLKVMASVGLRLAVSRIGEGSAQP
jgi:probable addiction module antidote protein